MGLDWNPLGRAKPGQEAMLDEVVHALRALEGPAPPPQGVLARLFGKERSQADIDRERSRWVERYREVSEPPYATLGAPRIGIDEAANQWIVDQSQARGGVVDERLIIERNHGVYVLDLLPVCDGFPVYTNAPMNSRLERYSFRAAFLDDVQLELGAEHFARAWTLMTAAELLAYGQAIDAIAKQYSAKHDVEAVAHARQPPSGDDPHASKAHILASAARWCLYWAERGHGLEPDF
jgi:hypothetical protein